MSTTRAATLEYDRSGAGRGRPELVAVGLFVGLWLMSVAAGWAFALYSGVRVAGAGRGVAAQPAMWWLATGLRGTTVGLAALGMVAAGLMFAVPAFKWVAWALLGLVGLTTAGTSMMQLVSSASGPPNYLVASVWLVLTSLLHTVAAMAVTEAALRLDGRRTPAGSMAWGTEENERMRLAAWGTVVLGGAWTVAAAAQSLAWYIGSAASGRGVASSPTTELLSLIALAAGPVLYGAVVGLGAVALGQLRRTGRLLPNAWVLGGALVLAAFATRVAMDVRVGLRFGLWSFSMLPLALPGIAAAGAMVVALGWRGRR